jgi:hypothetical protein
MADSFSLSIDYFLFVGWSREVHLLRRRSRSFSGNQKSSLPHGCQIPEGLKAKKVY